MFGTWRFEFSEGDSGITWPMGPYVISISYNGENITIDMPVELLNITGDPLGYKGAGITTIESNKYWYGGFIQNNTFSRTWVINHYSYSMEYKKDLGFSEMRIKIPNGSLGSNKVGEGAYSCRFFGYKLDS
ncbi:hypothetical protein J7L05_09985 [bacterium]|nr:hypothetical protein [bacterium]